MQIEYRYPDILDPIFDTDDRFIVIHGGRGSAKSWTVAMLLLEKGMIQPTRILCTREIQNSIRDSSHKLLSDLIKKHKLDSFYTVTEKTIRGINGSEFLFKGLRHDISSVRSTEGINICWVEEAQAVSRKSFEDLIPTVLRTSNSQMILTFNWTNKDDPAYVDFVENQRPKTMVIECNYWDNPFFPDALKDEMEYCKSHDYEKYLHIWCGKPETHAEDQIFYGRWTVEAFETPEDAQFFHGMDFGFKPDPFAAIRCFIQDNCLYIDKEAYKIELQLTKMYDYAVEQIPTLADGWRVIADSQRNDTIDMLRRQGMNIVGAKKGAGSLKDGIEKIKGFDKVIIHPDCVHTIDEFRHYKYQKNRLTGEIMPKPEDKSNHEIDSLRYSLEPYGKQPRIIRF